MAWLLRLVTALEIFLFLKKLREQRNDIAASNFKSSNLYENEVPEKHQATYVEHAQIRNQQ